MCGNGSVATMHPAELFGEDWMEWGLDAQSRAGTFAHGAAPETITNVK
jgi:hypothetical protein